MVSDRLKLSFNLLQLFKWLLEQPSLLAFVSVTSFFGIKGAFFSKTTRRIRQNFFQGLVENTCSLQPALKSNAPGL